MKFNIGDPVRTKKSGWCGYVMWYYPEIDEYLVSVRGSSRPSHFSRFPVDELEERKMGKTEIRIQQSFRRYMEMVTVSDRKHSCRGCRMVMGPRSRGMWKSLPCSVSGIRITPLDLYPFRKSRCWLRCKTITEADELRRKLKAKGR